MVFAVLGLAAVASATMAFEKTKLTLAGKSLSLDSVQVKGETYVSLTQLKAQMGAQGGANQLAGTEGVMNEWLFNGVWRFRVTKIDWNAEDEYWVASVEMRNGTNKTRHAGGQGLSDYPGQAFHLATESGDNLVVTSVSAGNELQDILGYKELAAGMGTKADIPFGRGKATDKPTKLILEFTALAGQGYVKDPSFRVDLTKSKE
ncbi:hypothetical protein EON81_11935 [bacterium]|nr:MAG: hypothetical protein EON81_11935 [bacterium]